MILYTYILFSFIHVTSLVSVMVKEGALFLVPEAYHREVLWNKNASQMQELDN